MAAAVETAVVVAVVGEMAAAVVGWGTTVVAVAAAAVAVLAGKVEGTSAIEEGTEVTEPIEEVGTDPGLILVEVLCTHSPYQAATAVCSGTSAGPGGESSSTSRTQEATSVFPSPVAGCWLRSTPCGWPACPYL